MKVGPGHSDITGRGLVAREALRRDETVLDVRADRLLPEPLFHYVNHSCGPNAVISNQGLLMTFCAVQSGDEITIDYTRECDFTEPFACECADFNDDPDYRCIGYICKNLQAGQAPRIPGLWLSGQVDSIVLTENGSAL